MNKKALAGVFLALTFPLSTAQATGLVTVYEQALAFDSGLAAERFAFEAESEGVDQSRAALLPRINAFAEASRVDRTDLLDDFSRYRYGVRLNQPLFRADAWYNFQTSKNLSKRAQAELSMAQQELILEVATQYFEILRAQDTLDTAIATEAALRRQWEQARERFNVGLIATTEVEEARAGYDASQSRRIAAESNLDIAREELARFTGRYHEELNRLRTDFPVTQPEPADPEAWIETAMMQNWSIQAARFAVDASETQVKASRAGHYPTLDFSAELARDYQGATSQDFGGGGGQQSQVFSGSNRRTDTIVALSLNVPLYSGGGTSSGVRRASAERNRSEQLLESARRNARLGTRTFYRQINTSIETLGAQRQTIVSRRSALDATRAGYDVGTRNIVELLDAEQNYYIALRDFAEARYDYVINTLRLKQQAGQLSPQDLIDLDRWLSASAPGIEQLAREVTRQEKRRQEQNGEDAGE
ncbi:MAG: TolC family outer membrane protein [Oleiphilaceae bacterium]|nr:TolC family outer membrane protein [Oleiphilaceae bacterium]